MSSFFATITVLLCFILLFEVIFWRLFRQKMKPLCFPKQADVSFFDGIAQIRYLRLMAIGHTFFLALTVTLILLALW